MSKDRTKKFVIQQDLWFRVLLVVMVSLPWSQIANAQQEQLSADRTEYFKLVSTVEYIAKRGSESKQYRHQAEPWFTVNRREVSPAENSYHIRTEDLMFMGAYQEPEYDYLSEINYKLTDKRYITELDSDLVHLQEMNNEAVGSLQNKAVHKVGKKWTHRFDLTIFDHYSLPDEIKFTVKSVKVPTDELGDLIAVQAISDHFLVKAAKQGDGYGYVKCQVASVYLFDPYVMEGNAEELYVVANVFTAATKMDDMTQQYRYEFGTYKTDYNEVAIDLSGLGEEYEDIMREIDLIPEPIEVKDWAGLPYWAQSEIVNAAQLASACSAIACEQSVVNPASNVFLAAARVYSYQGECALVSCGRRSVCQALRQDVDAITPLDICGDDGFLVPWWWAAAAAVVALDDNHHHHKSPHKP